MKMKVMQTLSSSKTKVAKSSHPTNEMVVSFIDNHDKHLIRNLEDTGTTNIIILEAYTSAPSIKIDDINTNTWSTMDGKFIINDTGICLRPFRSQKSILRIKCAIVGNFM
jgi:hypothetical protein